MHAQENAFSVSSAAISPAPIRPGTAAAKLVWFRRISRCRLAECGPVNQDNRPRRVLFGGLRTVYVDTAKNWQPSPGVLRALAANYVIEDGGERIYRDPEFPLTTSVATVQQLMKTELERVDDG